MAGSGMEVDPPTTSSVSLVPGHSGGHPLKRSNSAPMINILTSVCPRSPIQRHHHEHDGHCTSNTSSGATGTTNSVLCNHASQPSSLLREGIRTRRFSASYSGDVHSPTAALKTPYRLDQIKHEERIHIAEREAAHEREVQTTMQMSMSWDDLTLQDEAIPPKRPANFSEPLHIFTSPYPISSSPSPTRTGKQCFSPSLQAAVKAGTIQSRKTPSPTRKTFARRSGSPVTLRPSPLSIKRKLVTCDYDDPESYLSPPKRFHPIQGSSTPERLGPVISHPLIQCISSSSPSDSGSPEQQVPNLSLSSSAGSPARTLGSSMSSSAFTFRAVRRMGDNDRNSDMREMSAMSVGNQEESSVAMERESSNHSNLLNVSMDASPSGSFNSSTGRPTQV